jgi:hypothetical protein
VEGSAGALLLGFRSEHVHGEEAALLRLRRALRDGGQQRPQRLSGDNLSVHGTVSQCHCAAGASCGRACSSAAIEAASPATPAVISALSSSTLISKDNLLENERDASAAFFF